MGDELASENVKVSTFKCANGHALGQIHDVEGKSKRLLIYSRAIDEVADHPEQVEVIAAVEYGWVDVFCTICGSRRTWSPNRDAYERLMKHINKRRDNRMIEINNSTA